MILLKECCCRLLDQTCSFNKSNSSSARTLLQGEALGVSPIDRCTDCKLRISQCRICSSETAILTAAEEEEYNVLKEHVTFCKESGQLHAKYPFKKDPGILLDNGREAKACQISQERRQIKNGTHDQYVDQF